MSEGIPLSIPPELDPVTANEERLIEQINARDQIIASQERQIERLRKSLDDSRRANDSLRPLIEVGEVSLAVAEHWHNQTGIRIVAVPGGQPNVLLSHEGRRALDELANAHEEAGDL